MTRSGRAIAAPRGWSGQFLTKSISFIYRSRLPPLGTDWAGRMSPTSKSRIHTSATAKVRVTIPNRVSADTLSLALAA
jgi:hypothetical protein